MSVDHALNCQDATASTNALGQPNGASIPIALACEMRVSSLSSVQLSIGSLTSARSSCQLMRQAAVAFGIDERSIPRVIIARFMKNLNCVQSLLMRLIVSSIRLRSGAQSYQRPALWEILLPTLWKPLQIWTFQPEVLIQSVCLN